MRSRIHVIEDITISETWKNDPILFIPQKSRSAFHYKFYNFLSILSTSINEFFVIFSSLEVFYDSTWLSIFWSSRSVINVWQMILSP